MSTKRSRDQRGMVSILVTMIMILVISLIVVGFTQVANRNSRETLDRQLSMQAYYAAESGVNDAIGIIHAHPGLAQTSCDGPNYPAKDLNTDGTVGYTCVLVQSVVSDVQLTNVNTTTATIVPITLSELPKKLTFQWNTNGAAIVSGGCSSAGIFPSNGSTYNSSCGYALLRVDLMVGGVQNGDTALALNGKTTTVFMQPVSSGGGSDYTVPGLSLGSKGNIASASCGNRTCSITLDVTNISSTQYYLRLSTLYANANQVKITATAAGGGSLNFTGTQAKVDVTGKAQDVLRRVQVRVPLQNFAGSGAAAVQSQSDVCKRFEQHNGYSPPPSC